MRIQELIDDIHRNAVEHGWWETARSKAEVIALIHSEWSEALEESRAGHPLVWLGEHDKPEGIAVELADGVIRIFDYLGQMGLPETDEGDVKGLYSRARLRSCTIGDGLPELIAWLHVITSDAMRIETPDGTRRALLNAAGMALRWISDRGLDPIQVIETKHEYNKTRPYKHGKLF